MKEGRQSIVIRAFFFGQESSGKTSLLVRASKNTYSNQPAPIGIDFHIKQHYINGEVIKAQLWETPFFTRNHKYNFSSTMPAYLKSRNINIFGICFDLNRKESFEEGKLWLKKIKQLNTPSKLYLIGCKCDLEHSITIQQIRLFCIQNYLEYFQVSSKENKGVDEAISAMILEGLRYQKPNQKLKIDQPQPPKGLYHYCKS